MEQPILRSASNPRIRAAARLRDRRARGRSGLTLVDGVRELERALGGGLEIVEAFAAENLPADPRGAAVLARLTAAGVPTSLVSDAALARVAFGERSAGIVGVVRMPPTELARLALPADPLVVVLEGVEKPGNLGAVLRSADGAGASAVVAADPLTDLFNPNAIRASLGTIFTMPLAAAPSADVLDWLVEGGVRPVAARVDAAADYTAADLTGPVALVLGTEARGLGPTWHDPRVSAVRIPMRGVADSLNVSVAAAILLYEAVRQRSPL